MTINRRHFIASAAAFAASGAHAQSTDWAAIERTAKQEGSVIIYNTGVGLHRDVAAAFTARYGIKVNFLDMRASELRERVRIEQSAGRYLADLCLNGSTGAIIMDRAGHFEAHGGLPNEAHILPELENNGVRIPIFVNIFGFMINTRMVTPKGFRDLLTPFFKDKILADDPRAAGEGYATFATTYEHLGRDFQQALAKQNLSFTRNLLEGGRRVSRGEYAVYFPQKYPDYLLLKQLPVKFIWPQEGSPYQVFMLARLKQAPHPNAARLMLNFFLDAEAQMLYARSGRGVTIKGMLEKAPADIRAAPGAKLLGTTDPDREAEFFKLASGIYGPA